nr:NADH dehydrogenase subunit 2 [Microphthalmus similis]
MSPFIPLFSTTLVLGSLISISSTHWIFIWMGLELNLLSFIPLITSSNNFKENEAAVKYFLAQALGSSLLLLGALSLMLSPMISFSSNIMYSFITVGLLIKLGAAPCHYWFPQVMNSISWPLCIILSTWQKLAPLMIIMHPLYSETSSIIYFAAIISALVGGIGGLNQTQMRALLAYSSIGHMSWMLASMLFSSFLSLVYFSIYVFMTLAIMLSMYYLSQSSVMMSSSISSMSPIMLMMSMLLLLSLGGLPPLLGFVPKWLVIDMLTSSMNLTLPIILIVGSLINLFYYLSIAFSSIMTQPISLYVNKMMPPVSISVMSLMTITGAGLIPFLIT